VLKGTVMLAAIILAPLATISYPSNAGASVSTELSFNPEMNLSTGLPPLFIADDDEHDRYSMASSSDGQNAYVVWGDVDGNIFFRASQDGGMTFDPPMELTGELDSGYSPRIVASGSDEVYVTWINYANRSDSKLAVRASHDGGSTFDSAIELGPIGGVLEGLPHGLSTSGSHVYAIWYRIDVIDDDTVDGHMYFAASHDNGLSFYTKSLYDFDELNEVMSPQVASAGDNVYVSWDVSFRASDDNGSTFGPIINMDSNFSEIIGILAASQSNVYVTGATSGGLVIRVSHDKGDSFDDTIIIGDYDGIWQLTVVESTATENDEVYITIKGPDDSLLFSSSSDSEMNFGDPITLGAGTQPRMAVLGTNIYVVWRDDNFADLVFRMSQDKGNNFDPQIEINTSDFQNAPKIAAAIDEEGIEHVFIAWQDSSERSGPPEDSFEFTPGDVFFKTGMIISTDDIADFNGDGYADLAIGVPNENVHDDEGCCSEDHGGVNVIYGSPSGGLSATFVPDQFWSEADICGCEPTDFVYFGTAVGIGDFNGDGYSDLAVGAPNHGTGGGLDSGTVFVVYGSSDGLKNMTTSDGTGRTPQVWDQTAAGVQDAAESGDFFGRSLATGDFNNDGYDDLVVGVPNEDIGDAFDGDPAGIFDAGAVNVIYGSTDGLSTTFVADQFWHQNVPGVENVAEEGDFQGERFGTSLIPGDFNGDGYDDLSIGVPGERLGNIGSNIFAPGAVNVIYGSSEGLKATAASDGSGQNDQFWHQNNGLVGTAEDIDSFGEALATGDFNMDGYDDLAVGVPLESIGTMDGAGAVNVIYGSSAGLKASTSSDGTGRLNQMWHQNSPSVVDGSEAGEHFGSSLTVGDFNGDGFADLAIGVENESVGTVGGAGAANVIYGSSGGLSATGALPDQIWHQGSPGIEDFPETSDEFGLGFGRSLAAGDFNNDGYADLAAGVPGESIGIFSNAGALNVIYGSPTGLSATFVPDQFWHQDSPSIEEDAGRDDSFGVAVAATGG
jgi:hypothetical protein